MLSEQPRTINSSPPPTHTTSSLHTRAPYPSRASPVLLRPQPNPQGLKRPELRDELYMQLVRQTRGNPLPASRARAWELFTVVAAC